MLIGLIVIVHVLVALSLIMIILLQTGKGAGMGAAFGGSSSTLFGATGRATFLTKITVAAAIIFILTSLSLSLLQGGPRGVMQNFQPPAATVPAIPELPPAAGAEAVPGAAVPLTPAGAPEGAPAAPGGANPAAEPGTPTVPPGNEILYQLPEPAAPGSAPAPGAAPGTAPAPGAAPAPTPQPAPSVPPPPPGAPAGNPGQ